MKISPQRPTEVEVSYYEAPAVDEVRPYRIETGYHLVELVVGGVVRFEVGNRELRLGAGAMFWHIEGEDTIYQTVPEAPYKCYVFDLAIPPGTPRPVSRLSVLPDIRKAAEIGREFLVAFHSESVDRGILCESAWSRLVWEAHLAEIGNTGPGIPPSMRGALSFIESGYMRADLSVRTIASAAGLSEAHLHALFRGHFGQTPHQFVLARRIQEARYRLTGTRQTIKAIAAECGFANIETFYRVFQRQLGTTPQKYRVAYERFSMER